MAPLRQIVLLTAAALAPLWCQVTPIEVRIDDETIPPGGVVQLKVGLTDPHPISTGFMDMPVDEGFFDSFLGLSIYSPAGDVGAAAVEQASRVSVRFSSPVLSFGTDPDYPMMTVVVRTKASVPVGTKQQVTLDASRSFWKELLGTDIPFLLKPGTITAGGSLFVSNVIPGGGALPAGSVVRVLGGFFTPQTEVAFDGLILTNNVTFVNSGEMRVTLPQAVEMAGMRIRLRNPDDSRVTYFSYLRSTPMGASAKALLNRTVPLFPRARKTGGSIPGTPGAAGGGSFIALALENDNPGPATVSVVLLSSAGALLGQQQVTVPSGSRYVREVGEIFGLTPPAGSVVNASSATGIQMLGLVGDETAGSVAPVIPGAAVASQLFVTPASLSFSFHQGGPAPSAQTLNVASTGAGTNYTVAVTTAWLSASVLSGSTPGQIGISVNAASLGPGTYSGQAVVTASTGQVTAIPVTLFVNESRFLTVSPAAPAFVYSGGPPPPAQTLSITSPGASSYSATSSVPWLSVSPASAATPATPSLTVNPAGLAPGVHFGSISFTGPENVATVNVTLSVGGAASTGLRFVPINPCRVADTRAGSGFGGAFGAPALPAGGKRDFPIPLGACGIPAGAQAYSMNVTAVPLGPLGFLTAWPSGQARPQVSTLNSLDGRVTPNAAIIPAGANGGVSIYATDATNVILDLNGYFVTPAANGLMMYPVTPCRVADTRAAVPALEAGTTREFAVRASACGIPAGAAAYSLNITAIPSGTLGFLTIYPSGQPRPLVSTLNSFEGQIKANAAIVPAGSNGSVSVFVTDRTDVVIDINAYFAPPANGGLLFYPVAPCRAADTRGVGGALAGGATRTFDLAASACALAPNAQAYALNATAVPSGLLGFLTLWGAGFQQPFVSTLNSFDGRIVANQAIVPVGQAGVNAFVTDASQLILDVSGYFAP